MSSPSGSSSSASLKTSSLMRLTGTDLYSGLDTDTIIKKLVSGTQSKIDRQKQNEQIAEWRREQYRDIISDLKTFSQTYFSYTNSDTNILSKTFFKSRDIISSSDAVTATGDTSKASQLIINHIDTLAKQASYITSQDVSNKDISSGEIYESWTKSNVGGKSLIVNYDGDDYTLTLSHSTQLDSNNATSGKVNEEEFQKIVDDLNSQISNNSSLKGKVEFGLSSGHLTVTSTSGKAVKITDYEEDKDDTSGKRFLTALGFNANGTVETTGTVTATNALDTDPTTSDLFNQTISSDSEIKLNYNGENYTVRLGANIDAFGASSNTVSSAIAKQFQKQIDANSDLKGKVAVTADASGNISFSSSTGSLAVNGGSRNLLEGLGLASYDTSTGLATAYYNTTNTSVDTSILKKSYFSDTLAGNTLTFTLDGLEKNISLNDSELDQFSTTDKLAAYLNTKLATAFGSGKITVSTSDDDNDGNKVLTFETTDTTSVLSVTSSDNINVTGKYGSLRIASGETNRPELTKTLKELAENNEFATTLKPNDDGNYVLTINGKTMTFSQDTELSTVLSQINSDKDAGVNISYSSTSDKFSVQADDSGAQGTIYIQDVGGNLGELLMGTNYANTANARTAIQSSSLTSPVTLAQDTIYSFSLNGGTESQSVTLSAGTYTQAGLKTALENAISANSELNGKVTVTQNGDMLEFNTSDNSALSIAFTTGTDALGMGNSGKTNLSDTSSLTSLYTAGTDLTMNVSLDGGITNQDITRTSNNTTLDGVVLQIDSTSSSKITFSTSNNTDDLKKKITDFVDAYNKIIDKVNETVTTVPETNDDHKRKYNPLTDAQKEDMTSDEIDKWEAKAKKGILLNDSALSSTLSNLRSAMTSFVSSANSSLGKIGISVDSYDYTSGGKLKVNDSALEKALASDPDNVAELFTNTDGIAARVQKVLDKNVGTFGGDGILLLRAGTDTSINDQSELSLQIKEYESTISKLKKQLKTEQERWWLKFSAMETALSQLNSQAGYLNSLSGSSDS